MLRRIWSGEAVKEIFLLWVERDVWAVVLLMLRLCLLFEFRLRVLWGIEAGADTSEEGTRLDLGTAGGGR